MINKAIEKLALVLFNKQKAVNVEFKFNTNNEIETIIQTAWYKPTLKIGAAKFIENTLNTIITNTTHKLENLNTIEIKEIKK